MNATTGDSQQVVAKKVKTTAASTATKRAPSAASTKKAPAKSKKVQTKDSLLKKQYKNFAGRELTCF